MNSSASADESRQRQTERRSSQSAATMSRISNGAGTTAAADVSPSTLPRISVDTPLNNALPCALT